MSSRPLGALLIGGALGVGAGAVASVAGPASQAIAAPESLSPAQARAAPRRSGQQAIADQMPLSYKVQPSKWSASM